jgi:5-methylcytosine-specific restriction enzyme subunit McrC
VAAQAIPIANIYYLLSYAWNALDEAELTSVDVTPEMHLQDLLGRILRKGVMRLLKRGMDRSYIAQHEEIAGVRGRLDVATSLKRASFTRAAAWCTFDDLSPDVLHNQIIKTTLRELAALLSLNHELAEQLRELYRRMPGVREIDVTERAFRRVVLNRNNSYYKFLLDVCEIVQRNLLASEENGEIVFRDFTRDDAQMAHLFERFLFYFFRHEQSQYGVSARRLAWHATGEAEHIAYLPEMRTDVVLRDSRTTIVIDAKYYSDALGEHFSKASVRSSHLYQIYAYMSHLGLDSPGHEVRGVLMYPRTTATIRVNVELLGHPFIAATINLDQPWSGVRRDLLAIMSSPFVDSTPRRAIDGVPTPPRD